MSDARGHLLETRGLGKLYGNVVALQDISRARRRGRGHLRARRQRRGQVELHQDPLGRAPADEGELLVDGEPVSFGSPREALDHGIATVYQDLAMVPLMSVWRNFFLGAEPTKGKGPLQAASTSTAARRIVREELREMGIDIRDPDQPVGTLSGGERQCVAIARAVYFGARVLILDEPTSALGVKQAGVVLRYILQAARAGRRRHLHHAQPAPRLPGRRPLRRAEPRASASAPTARTRSTRPSSSG